MAGLVPAEIVMRWLQLALVVFSLSALGCPQPTPGKTAQPAASPGESPAAKTGEEPTQPGDPSETPAGTPGEIGGPVADAPPAWRTIPTELVEDENFYPMLKPLASWPDPVGLAQPASLPEAQRPPAVKIRLLKELVELCVHPDLVPKDLDAALGVDAQGRLFARLGRGKTSGSASLDTTAEGSKYPVFAVTLKLPAKGPHSVDALSKRVARVVAPALMKEIERNDQTRFAASPRVSGDQRAAGLALLDRGGAFGTQFPYVYAFGDDEHVVVLLQEVPHMSADGPR